MNDLLVQLMADGPYGLSPSKKQNIFLKRLLELTELHYKQCREYKSILDSLSINLFDLDDIASFPFLPVGLFKEYDLCSEAERQIVKVMTSSGTTGHQPSRIYLDMETSRLQTKVLSLLMKDVLGAKRLPMLVIDSQSVVRNRQTFSARGAGILGFSMYGKDVTFALDDQMRIDFDTVKSFFQRHKGESVFIFGFTFMIWQHFVQPLLERSVDISVRDAKVLHGGGWKKLADQAVSAQTFNDGIRAIIGSATTVTNYYGMVEQTGSLYVECDVGHLHCSVFSDVFFRRPPDFSLCDIEEQGIIEVVSVIPQSYPGHVLLTEDVGRLLGFDGCLCGRRGKFFSIDGRIPAAEVRGCSDTYDPT